MYTSNNSSESNILNTIVECAFRGHTLLQTQLSSFLIRLLILFQAFEYVESLLHKTPASDRISDYTPRFSFADTFTMTPAGKYIKLFHQTVS